jgi:hypothetical protein
MIDKALILVSLSWIPEPQPAAAQTVLERMPAAATQILEVLPSSEAWKILAGALAKTDAVSATQAVQLCSGGSSLLRATLRAPYSSPCGWTFVKLIGR